MKWLAWLRGRAWREVRDPSSHVEMHDAYEQDYVCPGCPECCCVKCGGHVGLTSEEYEAGAESPYCLTCGFVPEKVDNATN